MKIIKASNYCKENIESNLENIKEAYKGTSFLLNIDIRLYQVAIMSANITKAVKLGRKIESFVEICKDPIVKIKYEILNSYYHFYYKNA